jgi:predicted alpha/beta-fold hydrolase
MDSAVAVCPPVDLAACSRNMSTLSNRPYDRYFVNALMDQVEQRRSTVPGAPGVKFARRPRTIWEFDDQFTAAVCGFDGADHYYRESSSAQFVPQIHWPVLVLASRDDPLIPRGPLERIAIPASVELRMTDHGGHLGFIGRRGLDPDRRWMDWRVVDWVLARDRAARVPEMHRPASSKKLVSR